MEQTLSVVGAGHVGKVLARLWSESGLVEIGGIANRSRESAETAAQFIGAGTAVAKLEELPISSIYMLSVKDDAIGPCCADLAGVVERQMRALDEFDPYLAELYALLGRHAVEMAREAGNASPEGLEQIALLFNSIHQ